MFLIVRGGIPISVWKDGTIDIHLPNLQDMETAFGFAWTRANSFKGKITYEILGIEVKDPKVGQTIRFYDSDHKTYSHPLVIDAVYHNGNIEEQVTLQSLHSTYPNQISQFTNFTAWGEYGGYTLILKKYVSELAKCGEKATSVKLNTLIEAIKDFSMVSINPIGFIDDLISARILYIDNHQVKYDQSLIYLVMYQINCSFKMGGEPFPYTN